MFEGWFGLSHILTKERHHKMQIALYGKATSDNFSPSSLLCHLLSPFLPHSRTALHPPISSLISDFKEYQMGGSQPVISTTTVTGEECAADLYCPLLFQGVLLTSQLNISCHPGGHQLEAVLRGKPRMPHLHLLSSADKQPPRLSIWPLSTASKSKKTNPLKKRFF